MWLISFAEGSPTGSCSTCCPAGPWIFSADLLSLRSASCSPVFWEYHSLVAGLLGCFCWALGGLCWIISPAIALCPPAYCPLSCLVTPVSVTWNCVGPAIDPWGTALGLWAADHNSSILTVQPIFHPPCGPFKHHVLVQVLEAASSQQLHKPGHLWLWEVLGQRKTPVDSRLKEIGLILA